MATPLQHANPQHATLPTSHAQHATLPSSHAHHAALPSSHLPASIPTWRRWAGRIVSGLVGAFLVFDGVTKVLRIPPVVEASQQLGLELESIAGIGIVLLACTLLYAVPRSAILGAILLTGYLGGAAAIQVRAGNGAFPVAFAVGFGVLVWAGLALRDPRMLGWILRRQ